MERRAEFCKLPIIYINLRGSISKERKYENKMENLETTSNL